MSKLRGSMTGAMQPKLEINVVRERWTAVEVIVRCAAPVERKFTRKRTADSSDTTGAGERSEACCADGSSVRDVLGSSSRAMRYPGRDRWCLRIAVLVWENGGRSCVRVDEVHCLILRP